MKINFIIISVIALAAVAVVFLVGYSMSRMPAVAENESSSQVLMNQMPENEMANEKNMDSSETMMGGDSKMGDIIDIAASSENHTTLVAAVKAAGLVETLQGEGPFTVFAPVNSAFDALPAGTVDDLLKPESKDQLVGILTYHVVPTKAMSEDVVKLIADNGGMFEVETVAGGTLTLKTSDGKVTVTDESGNVATVTTADLEASNGVIHVIDKVLLPHS